MSLEMNVEVKDFDAIDVAYVRNVGPYVGDVALFQKLIGQVTSWVGSKGLINEDSNVMAIYYDDPSLVAPEKLVLDICMPVPADTAVEGDIKKTQIEAGKYAVAKFELSSMEYPKAWQMLFEEWLPKSGFDFARKPCLEIYSMDKDADAKGKEVVEICIPVLPA